MLGVVGALLQESYSVQGPDFKTTKNLFAAITDAPPLAILQVHMPAVTITVQQ
jgi:hypothetical protein